MVTDQTHEVTGVVTPDCTGQYRPAGTYNSDTYYLRDDNAFAIWWNGVDAWLISSAPGVIVPYYWNHVQPWILGFYNAQGTAVGVAEVTEI